MRGWTFFRAWIASCLIRLVVKPEGVEIIHNLRGPRPIRGPGYMRRAELAPRAGLLVLACASISFCDAALPLPSPGSAEPRPRREGQAAFAAPTLLHRYRPSLAAALSPQRLLAHASRPLVQMAASDGTPHGARSGPALGGIMRFKSRAPQQRGAAREWPARLATGAGQGDDAPSGGGARSTRVPSRRSSSRPARARPAPRSLP
jgi:hypothetical protein